MRTLILLLLPTAALAQNAGMCSDCSPPRGHNGQPIMAVGGVMGGGAFGVPMAPPMLNPPPPFMMGMFRGRGGRGGGRGGGGGGGRGGGGDPIMESVPNRSRPSRTRPNRKYGRRDVEEEEFAGIQRPRVLEKNAMEWDG
ncbi:hypothetical protein CGCF415_v007615 [Colletotrichum fructicola]|nr:uncharacterized protein CGMCC3_g14455 [Colletotrichum fructicola]KAE9569408.1 hypothetical protein CGMCC3_g14455 [Colletotrichum fructicola]KAF4884607.1 hypothetical protein CGCFRS4_v012567 [Colletotrichum fructicola]KAF4907077.1 hypothetical protein CGCF415_v007615 [Colletotrichum fructicola]KAF4936732.1 hypothetical protein CGCF245_v006410 [Colletotrichum fructicola]